MTKEEYVELFTDAIKKSDKALVGSINIDSFEIDEEDGYLYSKFSYQIDDRKYRTDKQVEDSITKILGDDYGVSLDRVDAFPDGYAAYNICIFLKKSQY